MNHGSTAHQPELVSAELLDLTRELGRPERDLVILAEGNTSQRLPDGRIVVKASGSRMRDADAEDFVTVDPLELMALCDSSSATQEDLTHALDAGVVDGRRRRGSIEALVHAAVQAVAPVEFVGHTHPTAVVGLLASTVAEQVFTRSVYSDEAVVLGRPLFVPYATPGIDLGRIYYARLREYADTYGDLPRLVLLANHGIVAIAPTAGGVDGISEMAVKSASVRQIALASGGLAPLTDAAVAKFFAREDVAERRENLAEGRL